jgi:hypothetical protein
MTSTPECHFLTASKRAERKARWENREHKAAGRE